MTSNAPISDELLSAYLDNAVTAEERALVEDAVAHNPDVAWRLSSLRYTVALLRQLPELHVPRTFTLQESQVAAWGEHGEAAIYDSAASGLGRRSEPVRTSWWTRVRVFWQAGNPVWRNAAAVCATVLVVLLVGGEMLTPVTVSPTNMARQTTADTVAVQESEPATAVEAPGENAAANQAEPSAKAAPAEESPAEESLAEELPAEEPRAEALAAGATADDAPPLAQAAAEQAPVVEESVPPADEPGVAARAAPRPGEDQAAPAAALAAAVGVDEAQVMTSAAVPEAYGAAADALGSPGSEDEVGDLFAGAPPPPGVAAPMAAAPVGVAPSGPLTETASGGATRTQTGAMTAASMPTTTPTTTPAAVAVLAPATTVSAPSTAPNGAPAPTVAPPQTRAKQPSAAGESTDQPATSTTSAPLDWWRMSRLGLAGLTVLFGALWLVSRRTRPAT